MITVAVMDVVAYEAVVEAITGATVAPVVSVAASGRLP